MQYRPRLKESVSKRRIVIGVIGIIVILFLVFLTLPKNCKTNEECFNLKASKCDKVKATLIKNDNQLNYRILGSSDNDCITKIKMVQVSEKQSVELKQALEGKSMDCAIPMSL